MAFEPHFGTSELVKMSYSNVRYVRRFLTYDKNEIRKINFLIDHNFFCPNLIFDFIAFFSPPD